MRQLSSILRGLAVLAVAVLGGQAALSQGTVSISGPAGPLSEGESATYTVTLSQLNSHLVTVPYTISGVQAADVHGSLTGRSVQIPVRTPSAQFVIHVLVDGASEGQETLAVTLGTPTVASGGTAPTLGTPMQHDVTISASTDSTASPAGGNPTITADASATNTTPGDTATFTIRISGFRAGRAVVNWGVQRRFGVGLRGVETWNFPQGARVGGEGYPSGSIVVPGGTDQSVTLELPTAVTNRLASAGTYTYRLHLTSFEQYTDAGEPPASPTNLAFTVSADGSIAVPATPGVLAVQRPAPASDDPAARPELREFEVSIPTLPERGGIGGTYTLREEPSRAQLRRAYAVLDTYWATSVQSAEAGYAAVFAVQLCANANCDSALTVRGSQSVSFDFSIGGSNGGLNVDYRAPRDFDGNLFSQSGNNWRATIPENQSGILIVVPLVDDNRAEPNETLNLQLVGTPSATGGSSVSLISGGTGENDEVGERSRDFTILGAEPGAEMSAAGGVTVSLMDGRHRGDRVTFTFTLTDDDTAQGDTVAGADADYRIWFTFHAGDEISDGNRRWQVLADGENAVFIPTTANVRNPFLSVRDEIIPSAGRVIQRGLGRNIDYPTPARGYGWVIIKRGETSATLEVATDTSYVVARRFIPSDWQVGVGLIAATNNCISPADANCPQIPLPYVDFNDYALTGDGGDGGTSYRLSQARVSTSAAWLEFASGMGISTTGGAVTEGDTRSYRVNFGGVAPTGTLDADNPLTVVWRLLGVNRHGDTRAVRPAGVGDLNVTSVTLGSAGVAFEGTAGSNGIDTIVSSDTVRGLTVIARQRLTITSWPAHGSEMFTVNYTVTDDSRGEPDEAYIFQVTTDRPAEVGEIAGRGSYISASDMATVTVQAYRGMDTDGDNSDGSWDEAAPAGNNSVLRFRIVFPASGSRPEADTSLQWEVADAASGTAAEEDDFLLCRNDACTVTQVAGFLPRGRTRISATEAAKTTGPWHIVLPITLRDDGTETADSKETFAIKSPDNPTHHGTNVAAFTQDFTINSSGVDTGRLVVGIGDASLINLGSGANRHIAIASSFSGTPAVAAATTARGAADIIALRRAVAQSGTIVSFPVTLSTPDGPISETNQPQLSGHRPDPLSNPVTLVTGAIQIHYRVDGSIFDNGVPADGGAALSNYQRTHTQTYSPQQIIDSWRTMPSDRRLFLRPHLPLASVANPETFTVTITSVEGNGGAISQNNDVTGQLSIRQRGGSFSLSDGAGGTSISVNEGSSQTLTVTYDGVDPIPAGGVTLDWAVMSASENSASAEDFGTGGSTFPSGDNTISFAAGAMNGATATFTVSTYDDNIGEQAENFRVVISDLQVNGMAASDSLSIAQSSVDGAIAISDHHTFALDCPSEVPESTDPDPNCTVFYIGAGLTSGATLDWAVQTPNASYQAEAADFGTTSPETTLPQAMGGVIFPPGAQQGAMSGIRTITVPIYDDTAAEGDERFVFSVSNPTVMGDATALTVFLEGNDLSTSGASSRDVTILSSDAALTVTCAAAAGLSDLVEGTATTVANCRQTTGSPLTGDVEIAWTLYATHGITSSTAGSATEATDFVMNSGVLTLDDGTASGTDVALQITASEDGTAEAAEQFSLVITTATGPRYTDASVNYNQDLTVAASQAGAVLQFEVAVASSVSDVNSTEDGTQVDENVGTVAFTVSFVPSRDNPPAPASNVTVDWAVSGVSPADDLTGYPATRTLTFTPANYQTPQTVALTVNDDGVNEATENLIVTLSNATGPGATPPPIGTATAQVQVQDNDTLTFTVARKTPASGAVSEGGSQVFSVTPSGGTIASGTTVTVPWSVGTDSDNATADAEAGDFRATGQASDTTALTSFPSSGTTPLSFTGHAAQDVTIWTLDDSTLEGEETFQLSLGTIAGADGATATADSPISAQIAVSDAPTFTIQTRTASFPSVNAEGQSHSFDVIGTNFSGSDPLQVTCTVSGSEVEAGDFRASASATEALAAFPTQTLNVQTAGFSGSQDNCTFYSFNDSTVEGDEDFTVTITVTSGIGIVTTATAQGTIQFSDFQVGFTQTAFTLTEAEVLGNDGVLTSGETGEVCVAVTTPDSGTGFPAGVSFSVSASTNTGTAVASDYTAITNQTVGPFNDSRRRRCFDVETAHDVLNEGAETFSVDVAPLPGESLSGRVTINPSSATITIPANDPLLVGVTADQTQVDEGDTASFTLAFAPVSLTSSDGMQTQEVTHTPTAATTVEWALSGTGITASDFTGIASLTTGNSSTIALTSPDYGIDIMVAEEAAQDPDDVPETFTLTVTGGSSAGAVQAASTGAAANVEIVAAGTSDPTFTITRANTTVTEGAAATNVGFSIALSNAVLSGDGTDTVELTWTVTNITTSDADFTSTTGTVDIDDDEMLDLAEGFNVPIAADDLNEDSEQFSVQISVTDFGGVTGGIRIGNAPIVMTLNDNAADATAVTIARDSGTQSSVAEAAAASFTVTLSGGIRTGALTVPVSFSGLEDGEYDITAPTGDYDDDPATPDSAPLATATGLTLVFPGPSAMVTPTATDSITVTVDLLEDTVNEATETLTLTGAAAGATGLRIAVGSVSYATNGDTDSVNITDNDPISVSIAIDTTATPDDDADTLGHQRQESTSAQFTVTLSTASAAAATIPYTISGVDAADYTDQTATRDANTSTNGQLIIPAGSTTGTIFLNLEADADVDTSEDLTVTLTAPDAGPPVVAGPSVGASGGTIALSTTQAQQSATVTIIPLADARTLSVTGAATHNETDGDTVVTYTVALAGTAFTDTTEVSWAVTPGSGTEAADFSSADPPVAPSGSIMFPTTTTFEVTIIGDNVNEADEVFSVQLSVADADADGGTAFGSPQSTTIVDDDDMTYSIAADSATVDEEATDAAAGYTVTLSGAASSEGDVTIPITLGGSATGGGTDYTDPSPLSVTVSAGDTTADLDIALVNDNLAEAAETIIVTLGATPTVGAGGGDFALTGTAAQQNATVSIEASDSLTVTVARLSTQSGDIAEDGGSANFVITLTGTTDVNVEVPFSVGGTGITADDYDITSPTVGVTPASTTAIVQVLAGTDNFATFTIQATDDSNFEGPETLVASLLLGSITPAGIGPVTITAGGSGTTEVVIDDDEGVTVTIAAASSANVAEGNNFTITATPTAHDQDVVLSVAFGSTTDATDNDAEDADTGTPGGTVLSTSGAPGDITIAAVADDLNEGDESFTVTITGTTTAVAGGASIPVTIAGEGQQTLTVQDNATDAITVDIALDAGPPAQEASVDENGEARFTVSLGGGTRTRDLIVPFEVSGPGGTRVLDDSEFAITMPGGIAADATDGMLTFPLASAGTERSLDLVLDLVGDSVNEPAEDLIIVLAAPGGSGLRHSGGLAGAISYTSPETDGSRVGPTVSVTDDDALTYSITAPMAQAEGDSGTGTLSFTVSLSGGTSAQDILIPYTLGGSEASGGPASQDDRDFTWPAAYDPTADSNQGRGSVRIAAGETSAMLDLEVVGDTRPEGDEDIIVTLQSPATGGGEVNRAADAAAYRAVGTITGDDATHIFSLSCPDPADATATATLTEAASGDGPTCTATYSSDTGLALNAAALLSWAVQHSGGAVDTSPADFAGGAAALSGDVTIPAGSTGDGSAGNSVDFTLPRAMADNVSEAAETFTVALSLREGQTALPTAGTANAATQIVGGTAMPQIAASDPLTVSIGDVSGTEQDANADVNFPVSFAPGGVSFEGSLALAYRTILADGATDGDFSLATSPLSIDGAEVSGGSYDLPVTVRADDLNEAAETVTVRLLSATLASANISLGGADDSAPERSGVLTIAANDATTVSIAAAASTAAEGTAANFTVTLGGGTTTADVTLAYSFNIAAQTNTGPANDASNPDASDPGSGSITIDAGDTTATIAINISPDGLEEAAENLVVTLGAVSGGGGGGIGVADGAGSAQVEIPANAAALHVVNVSGPATGAMEGGSAVFTFTLPPDIPAPNARNAELTAEYSITGVADGDYRDPGNGRVTFPIGSTEQTVTITITDDMLNEGAETLTVQLTGITQIGGMDPLLAVGGSAASGSATVEIAASDPLTVTLQRSGSGSIAEGGEANFQFVLSGAQLSADATIPYTISGTGITRADLSGNDAAGLAADALTGSVTVAAASSSSATTNSASIRFTATDDALNEATETFAIEIGTPSVAAGGGEISATQPDAANGQVGITDNDALTLAVSGPASVGEGSVADFTVTLTGAADGSAGTLEVAYSVVVGNSQNAAASVAANSDAAPDVQLLDANGNIVDPVGTGANGMASGTLTIAAGATTATIQLRANFDNLNEAGSDADNPLPDETLTLTLTGVTPQANVAGAAAAAAAPGNAHTTNIENVNAARTLSVSVPQASQSVAETAGASIGFEIALTGAAPVSAFVVDWSLESDGAQLPAASASGLARQHGGPHPNDPDVGGPLSGTVSFAAGSMAPQTVTVPVLQDSLNEGDEALRLRIRVRDPADGGVPDGFPAGAPATQVSVETGRSVIPQNDPIVLALVRPAGQSGAQTGDDFGFAVSFGCADGTSLAAGNCDPVVPSTDVAIPYTYTVGGTAYTDTLMVAAGQTAAAVNEAAAGGTPVMPPAGAMTALMNPTTAQTVEVSFGTPMITPPANAPAGAAAPEARTITATEQMEVEAAAEVARREGRPVPQETVATVQVQVGAFSAALNTQRIEAPEGTSAVFTVTLGVAGAALTAELSIPWSVTLAAPGFAPPGSAVAEAADFGGGAAPGGTLSFPAGASGGDLTQTISIAIATDDLDEIGGEYFQVALGAASGTDAPNVAVDTTPAVVLIPSLRATLSVGDVMVAEGADAVFMLSLADFVGGQATTQPLEVHYILEDDTATRGDRVVQGADYVAPLRGVVTIPPRGTSAEIRIPVLQDGVLEPVETFRLRFTVTADGTPPADGGRISGGGGVIEFNAAEGTGTATISDDIDQASRRTQRVAAMVSALDRQTVELATDAITGRFERAPGGEAQTALSIAGRSLIGGASAAGADAAASRNDLGLALFGAAGLGDGAGAGLPGAGASAGLGGGAFGGLGAGISGGENVWRGQELPSLTELVGGTSFSFGAASWTDLSNIAEGLEVWGRGGTSDLKANLSGSNGNLRYKGDSIAVFVGADRPVRDDMLAGLAVGYSVGDLKFTDTSVSPVSRFEMKGSVDTRMLSVHPYFSWWITPEVNTWLALGYGTGSVDLEEEQGEGAARIKRTLPGTADSSMWMMTAGVSGRVRVTEATRLKLSFELSRVSSEVDASTFDDGARLNDVRARNLRVGGEAEVSHSLALPGGFALQPFATGRLRFESGGQAAVHGVGNRDAAFDLGGGVAAAKPDWGLDAQVSFSGQVNSSGQEEQQLSVDLSYDLAGDKQGLTMSVQTAFSERRSGSASGSGNGLWGFGSTANNLGLGGGSFGALSGSAEHSITGEIGYGVSFRQLGRAGLLTPYGRFDLRQSDSRWAAGLRLAETGGGLSLGLEGGLDLQSGLGAAARDFDLMLTGQLRF